MFARFIFLFPFHVFKTKCLLRAFHTIPSTLSVSSSSSSSVSHLALPAVYRPVGLFCKFIIVVSVGFWNSHIHSIETPEHKTLSERTDHLCVVSKATLLAPSSTSSQQMEMQLRTRAARSHYLFITVQDIFACRRICSRVRGGFRLLNMQCKGGGAKLVGVLVVFFLKFGFISSLQVAIMSPASEVLSGTARLQG